MMVILEFSRFLSWLKSSGLSTQAYISSDRSGWSCAVSGASDIWTKTDHPELSSGDARATVAARGLRVPRFAGRGDGVRDSDGNRSISFFTDGILTMARGHRPIIKTDPSNFIDQYMVGQTVSLDKSDSQIAKDSILGVIPLRP